MTNNQDEQIRLRAHEIWESEGQPHGRDEEHWQRARAEIESEVGASGTGAFQAASRRGSSSDPAQDSAAPGRTRKAAAANSGAQGERPAKTKKARSTTAGTAVSVQRSGSPSTSASKRKGTMPSELGGRRGEHSDASPSARYRHPENPDLTWGGRGRRPAWIREAVEAGRALSDFEIGA